MGGSSASRGNGGRRRGSSGMIQKLSKYAVKGLGYYSAHKKRKLKTKWSRRGRRGSSFEDWDEMRQVDGLLCRYDSDCTWIDPNLDCQDYELQFTPNAAWYGGDFASIRGACTCPLWMASIMEWDENEL